MGIARSPVKFLTVDVFFEPEHFIAGSRNVEVDKGHVDMCGVELL